MELGQNWEDQARQYMKGSSRDEIWKDHGLFKRTSLCIWTWPALDFGPGEDGTAEKGDSYVIDRVNSQVNILIIHTIVVLSVVPQIQAPTILWSENTAE